MWFTKKSGKDLPSREARGAPPANVRKAHFPLGILRKECLPANHFRIVAALLMIVNLFMKINVNECDNKKNININFSFANTHAATLC